ncbi:MAG: hypothetical protein J0L93_02080 [Deltaproteobacteria bacterium]|nr:hypothetical protein [Deltaproteobacteria bacterium]
MKNFLKNLKINIYSLRIWNPDAVGIKRKFFLKDEVVFGSDKKSDVVLKDLEGLHARFNFSTNEIYFLSSGKTQSIEAGSLFQIGRCIFQCTEIRLFSKQMQITMAAALFGIFLLWSASLLSEHSKPACSSFAMKIADGLWNTTSADLNEKYILSDLQEFRKSFSSALKEKNWIKARGELNSIQQAIASARLPEACRVFSAYSNLEARLSEHLIGEHLQNREPILAARELEKFANSALVQNFSKMKIERWKKKIRQAAGKLYLEGYEIEEEDLEKANELYEKAQATCLALHLPSECYRGIRKSDPATSAAKEAE